MRILFILIISSVAVLAKPDLPAEVLECIEGSVAQYKQFLVTKEKCKSFLAEQKMLEFFGCMGKSHTEKELADYEALKVKCEPIANNLTDEQKEEVKTTLDKRMEEAAKEYVVVTAE